MFKTKIDGKFFGKHTPFQIAMFLFWAVTRKCTQLPVIWHLCIQIPSALMVHLLLGWAGCLLQLSWGKGGVSPRTIRQFIAQATAERQTTFSSGTLTPTDYLPMRLVWPVLTSCRLQRNVQPKHNYILKNEIQNVLPVLLVTQSRQINNSDQ